MVKKKELTPLLDNLENIKFCDQFIGQVLNIAI